MLRKIGRIAPLGIDNSWDLSAVMSCSGTRLCAASMTKASWDPCSQCGSGISSRFCTLTTQSADSEDLEELPTAKSTDIRTPSMHTNL